MFWLKEEYSMLLYLIHTSKQHVYYGETFSIKY